MSRPFISLIFLVLVAVSAMVPAKASNASPHDQVRPLCAPARDLARFLLDRHGETVVGAGLNGTDALFTLYASAESGSWTLVISRADGRACAVAAGQHWRSNPDFVSGTPS